MPAVVGHISLYMGPDTIDGPDSLETAILGFIGGAQKELLISVQELDHRPIAEAIIAARRRGVRVAMILEQDYLREAKVPGENDMGANEINRELLTRVLRTAVDAKADYNPSIFHQKFVVRDRSAVITGSTNFTTTGVSKNLNHLVIIDDEKVAKEYAREFRELRQGIFGRHSLNRPRKPLEDHFVSDVRVKPLFAPDHNPEMEFMKQMNKAKARVDFAAFTFAQSSGIDDTMLATAARQVDIRGALDRKQANQTWAATKGLVAGGIEVFKNKTGTGVRKIHHKLMVIDDAVTIVGSFNYTGPANLTNDENIVVLGDQDATDPAQIAAQTALAAYARAEIDRIITDQCEPITS